LRRGARVAAILVALAAFSAIRADPAGEHQQAVIAAHDIEPGVVLTADDLITESRLISTLPDGTQHTTAPVVGATTTGPVRRGEVITDVRTLGSRLAQSSAGPDSRIVPLHLDDAAVVELLRAGDIVDVLSAPQADTEARPTVIATNAVVVSVSAKPKAIGASSDRVVLVALPAAAAHTVAGATLVQAVTIVLH